jgi:hypothetical protein
MLILPDAGPLRQPVALTAGFRLLSLGQECVAELRDGGADLQVGPHPAGLKTGRSIHTV